MQIIFVSFLIHIVFSSMSYKNKVIIIIIIIIILKSL